MNLMDARNRQERLRMKFREMRPVTGDSILIGIGMLNDQSIYQAASDIGCRIAINKIADQTATRDDGVTVPVWLVTFK